MFKYRYLFLVVALVSLTMFSCREQSEIIIDSAAESALLEANSSLAGLMERTSMNDGSSDNILDNANCFKVKLPVTVIVNGVQITINSEDDYDEVERIFEESETDDDTLEFIYPITLIGNNHHEIQIQNREQFRNRIRECKGENEIDDDIECVDFVYPINVSVYNTISEQNTDVTINDDAELYDFIDNIGDNDVVTLHFPISLMLADGTVITANNTKELRDAIDMAKDDCDEDDDYDYDDDDCMNCTQEKVNELLTSGCNKWIVDELEINGDDLDDNYDGYDFYFYEDGTLTVKYGMQEYTGTWEVTGEGNDTYLKLEVTDLPDFNNEWRVYEIKPDPHGKELKLRFDDNILEFKSNCEDSDLYGYNHDDLSNLLTQGCNKWIVDKLEIDGNSLDGNYDGYYFYFYEDGTLSVKYSMDEYTGTWEIIEDAGEMRLKLEVNGLPDYNYEWMIYEIKPDPHGKEVKLRFGDNILEFKSDCGNSNCYQCSQQDASYVLTQGCNTWLVDDIEINGNDLGSNYTDYYFFFNADGTITLEYNFDTYNGTWSVSGEGYNLILTINIEGLNDFNAEWYIEELKPEEDKEVHLRSGNNVLKFKSSCN